MRAAVVIALASAAPALGQAPKMPERVPAPQRQAAPQKPGEPARLPAPLTADAQVTQAPATSAVGDPSVKLPQAEARAVVDPKDMTLYRHPTDGWQIVQGRNFTRQFGANMLAAEEARRVMREMGAAQWVSIGPVGRPTLEYGLTADGHAESRLPHPRYVVPIQAGNLRAEQVKGVWVARDDASILANFGASRADAEQAVAVVRRYGFNRVGYVGFPTPEMSYLYYDPSPTDPSQGRATSALMKAAAEQSLTRTGVPVPGGDGYVGERVVIDARKAEVRKERGEFVLACGPDVLARFATNEWAAHDALKVVRDGHFTEFCKVGGVTFFLVNGKAPGRTPFGCTSVQFDPARLSVLPMEGAYVLTDARGRRVVTCPTAADAEAVLKLVRAYEFDTLCGTNLSPRTSLQFFVHAGR